MRWIENLGVIEETEDPGAQLGKAGHPQGEDDRAVFGPALDAVDPHLLRHPGPFDAIDPDPRDDVVVPLGPPRLVGKRGLDVDALGDDGTARNFEVHRVLDPVDTKRAHRGTVEVPRHQVPVPEAEPQPGGRDTARALAIGERCHALRAHRLEEIDQRTRRHQRGDGTHLAQTGRTQLQEARPDH